MGRVAILVPKDLNGEENKECPVCGHTFQDTTRIEECSIGPDELKQKHCFKPLGPNVLLVIEHSSNQSGSIESEDEEAVDIEIN